MKTIVVPTDFSAVSSNAAHYALALAERLNTSVTLFHTYPISFTFSETPVPPQVFDTLQNDAENFLKEAKADLELANSKQVEIKTYARPGSFLTCLQEFCSETAPYAVVMSSHGRAGLEQLLLGSETSATVRYLPWPLIVVPHGAKFKSPRNIALACDFQNVHSTVPAQMIRKLVDTFKANLFVLHVHSDAKKPYQEDVIDGTSDLQEMLEDLHPSYHFIDSEDVTEAILDFVEKNDIDLLIAFPKRHNFLESLFHKSQSKALAKETLVPFMTFHEK